MRLIRSLKPVGQSLRSLEKITGVSFILRNRFRFKPVFLRIRLSQQHGEQHTIGRFKLSLQTGFTPELEVPEKVSKILAVVAAERTEQQRMELLEHF